MPNPRPGRKARPKTGERRETNQPLKIDKLPSEIQQSILHLRNRQGKTWQEIEQISAEPVGKGKQGFIEWEKLETKVLELFPDMRLPHTTLHRWYDLRVKQVQQDLIESSTRARLIAQAFAKATVAKSDEAVINAARDQVMTILSENGDQGSKMGVVKALTSLAEVMQTARGNDIKERKVGTEERRIKLLEQREAAAIRKMETETQHVARKVSKGELTLDDINRLRERTFGLPPLVANAAK